MNSLSREFFVDLYQQISGVIPSNKYCPAMICGRILVAGLHNPRASQDYFGIEDTERLF